MSDQGGQQPVILVVQQTKKHKIINESYPKKPGVLIGFLQLICAVITFITGVMDLDICTHHVFDAGFVGTGIWSSLLFLASGVLSLCAGKRPQKWNIVTGLGKTSTKKFIKRDSV